MATIAMSLIAERWLDEVLLYGAATLPAGEITDGYTLPAGVGDVAVMELEYTAISIATMIANPELWNVRFTVATQSNSSVDFLGVYPFRRYNTTALGVYGSPDPLVYWRQGEKILVQHTDVDTNVSPTVVGALLVKAVRIKPVSEAAGPVQLVR